MLAWVQDANREQPSHQGFLVFDAWWNDHCAGRPDDAPHYDAMLTTPTSPATPWAELAPGSRFDSYVIEGLAGHGGQATVYRARDTRLDRRVALKILHPHSIVSETLRSRFEREGRLVARLDHPGICSVLQSGVKNGRPYLAMPWLDGVTLDQHCRSTLAGQPGSPTRIDAALKLGTLLAQALEAAHAAGILHRDIKPGNIMVTATGSPILLDFGIAGATGGEFTALTMTGDRFGTLGYMAPEQCGITRTRGVDERADQFALAVVIWELLAGAPLFPSQDRLSYETALRSGRLPTLPGNRSDHHKVVTVLTRALRFDPRERFPSLAELRRELERCVRGTAIQTRRPGPMARSLYWARREPFLASLGGALVASLGAAALIFWNASVDAERATRQAEWNAYASGLSAARSALRSGDLGTAVAELKRCPEALRGWEWRRLHFEIDPSSQRSAQPAALTGWRRATAQAKELRPLANGSHAALVPLAGRQQWQIYHSNAATSATVTLHADAVALSADGRSIWYSDAPGTLHLTTPGNQPAATTLHGRFGPVRTIHASPCSRFLAIYAGTPGDSYIELLRLPEGQHMARIPLRRPLSVLLFHSSGERLLIATADPVGNQDAQLRWHATRDGQILSELKVGFRPSGPALVDPRDQGVLLAVDDGTLRWLDAGLTRERDVTFAHGSGCAALWFDASEDLIYAIDSRGASCAWQGLPPHASWSFELGPDSVRSLSFSTNSTRLIAADRQGRICVTDSDSLRRLRSPWAPVHTCVHTANGIVIGGTKVACWSPASSTWTETAQTAPWFVGKLAADGKAAFVARGVGRAPAGELGFIADLNQPTVQTGNTVSQLYAPSAARPRHLRMVIVDDAALLCRDFAKGQSKRIDLSEIGTVTAVALDSSAESIAIGTEQGRLAVLPFGGGPTKLWQVSQLRINALAFLRDDDRLLLAIDEELKIFGRAAGVTLTQLKSPRSQIATIAIDPSGHRIALGCIDGSVHVLNDSQHRSPAARPDALDAATKLSLSATALVEISGLPLTVYDYAARHCAEALQRSPTDLALLAVRRGQAQTVLATLRRLSGIDDHDERRVNYRASLCLAIAQATLGESAGSAATLRRIARIRTTLGLTGRHPLWVEAQQVAIGKPPTLPSSAALRRTLLPLCLDEQLADPVRNALATWMEELDTDTIEAPLLALIRLHQGDATASQRHLLATRADRSPNHLPLLWCASYALALAKLNRRDQAATFAQRVYLVAESDNSPDHRLARILAQRLQRDGL